MFYRTNAKPKEPRPPMRIHWSIIVIAGCLLISWGMRGLMQDPPPLCTPAPVCPAPVVCPGPTQVWQRCESVCATLGLQTISAWDGHYNGEWACGCLDRSRSCSWQAREGVGHTECRVLP